MCSDFSYLVQSWCIQFTARSAEVEPPGLDWKCGKRVERYSDFGKYKRNFRNHITSVPTYHTLSMWGKWVDRLSDFGKFKGYIRNHSTSLPAYRTLSQVRGGSTSADLAVCQIKNWKSTCSLKFLWHYWRGIKGICPVTRHRDQHWAN